MNDLERNLCLEVVQGHDNHCTKFAVEYLANCYR